MHSVIVGRFAVRDRGSSYISGLTNTHVPSLILTNSSVRAHFISLRLIEVGRGIDLTHRLDCRVIRLHNLAPPRPRCETRSAAED